MGINGGIINGTTKTKRHVLASGNTIDIYSVKISATGLAIASWKNPRTKKEAE